MNARSLMHQVIDEAKLPYGGEELSDSNKIKDYMNNVDFDEMDSETFYKVGEAFSRK